MSESKSRQEPLFSFEFNRPIKVRKESPTIISDADVLPLQEVEDKLAVDHPSTTVGHVFPCLPHFLVGASVKTESAAFAGKSRVKQRFEDLKNSLLHKPVHHRWNAQSSHSIAARLADFHAHNRTRSISFPFEASGTVPSLRPSVQSRRRGGEPGGVG